MFFIPLVSLEKTKIETGMTGIDEDAKAPRCQTVNDRLRTRSFFFFLVDA